jgi:hypothetical protein
MPLVNAWRKKHLETKLSLTWLTRVDTKTMLGHAWTMALAQTVWKLCQSLRGDMMHDKLISLIVEWCQTPPSCDKCVAYIWIPVPSMIQAKNGQYSTVQNLLETIATY